MSPVAPSLLIATTSGLFDLDQEHPELERHEIGALDHGPAGTWAVVDGHELWQDDDGWTRVASADAGLGCVLSAGSGVFVGSSNAHLLRLSDRRLEIVEGFERVDDREDWYTPWGGPPDVRSMARATGGTIFVNVHVGGILRSDDDGEKWTQTIDIDTDVHEVFAAGESVFAATAYGLAYAGARQDDWTFHDDGLHATYARAVTLAGDRLLMSASDGPRGGRAAVYSRTLGDNGPFEKCETGLPTWFKDNIDTGCLTSRDSTVVFGTREGTVFVSNDSGNSWTQARSDLPPIRRLRFLGDG